MPSLDRNQKIRLVTAAIAVIGLLGVAYKTRDLNRAPAHAPGAPTSMR